MSEKQTKNTNEILSNVWNWEHTEDGGRRSVPNPHPVIKKEKMLKEIYKKIADKTLSFGCKVKLKIDQGIDIYNSYYPEDTVILADKYQVCTLTNIIDDEEYKTIEEFNDIYEIIGNPVMIGDVLYWIESRGNVYDNISDNGGVIRNWKQKRKPLSDQSDECIRYIYSLLPEVRK